MNVKQKFKAYVAIYLVLIKDEQVLMLLRSGNALYQGGKYSLVAGHLDGGETAKQGIMREAGEEAGITLNSDDLEVVHMMHRQSKDREYIDIFLRAEKWTGDVKNMELEKCDELKWFALNNLPKNIVPEVKQALENIKKKVSFSEFGWDE